MYIYIYKGVIDADYRGAVGVVLFNHGENDLDIKQGHILFLYYSSTYEPTTHNTIITPLNYNNNNNNKPLFIISLQSYIINKQIHTYR